jgi:hypothetical protein
MQKLFEDTSKLYTHKVDSLVRFTNEKLDSIEIWLLLRSLEQTELKSPLKYRT